MRTYSYHLFLRNPETKDCTVMTVSTDVEEFLEATELFRRLSTHEDLPQGYALVGLNVGLVIRGSTA